MFFLVTFCMESVQNYIKIKKFRLLLQKKFKKIKICVTWRIFPIVPKTANELVKALVLSSRAIRYSQVSQREQ